jgi:tetratricopeptide (TPR) repeat protein
VSVTDKNYICYNNYAQALLTQGRLDDAIEQLNHALEAKSDYVGAMVNLGAIYKVKGELDVAEQYYQRAIARNENYYPVLNNLAWLRATSKNERYRDAQAAIRLAQHALDLANRSGDLGLSRQAEIMDTLAAAYAAGGQFDRAVDLCQESISLAHKNRQNNLLSAFQERLALYQQGKAFYE